MHAALLAFLIQSCAEAPPPEPPPEPTPEAAPPATPPEEAVPAEAEPANPNGSLPRELPAGAPARIRARHILIPWEGTVGADPRLRRTRAEAWAMAEAAAERVASGEDFAAVAREVSEEPSAPRGGDLGAFGRGAMDPDFERAAFSLKVGQTSGIVETPFGFHLVQRLPLDEVHIAQVLVQYAGVERSASQRSREEALTRAEEAVRRLRAGEDVAQVAADLSDGPTARRGGDLGWFQRGQMLPQIDEAAFLLDRGDVSDVVTSPIGFHVLVRLE